MALTNRITSAVILAGICLTTTPAIASATAPQATTRQTTAATPASPIITGRIEDRCPAANVCIFQGFDGKGRMGATYYNKKNLADSRVWSGFMNDRTSSIRVNRLEPWCMYEHKDYAGSSLMIDPNSSMDFEPSAMRWWDNRISSFREARQVRDWPWSKPHWEC